MKNFNLRFGTENNSLVFSSRQVWTLISLMISEHTPRMLILFI